MSINGTTIKGEIISDIKYLLARILAEGSHIDAAQDLLPPIDKFAAATTSELDLLARIAIAKGNIEQARRLWELVLSREPNHAGAVAALRRLGPYWLPLAIMRRVCLIASVALVILLALLGANTFLSQPRVSVSAGIVDLPEEAPEQMALSPSIPESPIAIGEEPVIDDPVKSTPFIDSSKIVGISGIVVAEQSASLKITFSEGVFLDGSALREPARMALRDLSRVLALMVPEKMILIEGHTDSVPMHPNSPFGDNYSLGINRAWVVANLIRKESPALASQLTVCSVLAPEESGPDGEEALPQPQHRTVVIRILPSFERSDLQ